MSSSNNPSFPTVINPTQPVVNLAAIGDSRTYLNHAGNAAPFGYRFNNGVINQAMAVCRERLVWKQAYNLGVSGDTAQGIDQRKMQVATLMATRPASEEWDLVYWVDINDAIGGVTVNNFLGFFQSAMKYFMNLGIRNIYVCSGIPYPQGYLGETTGQHTSRIALIKGYNSGMQSFCANSKGLHYVDNYFDYGNGADVPQDTNSDIHPGYAGAFRAGTNLGNRIIAARGINTLAPGRSVTTNPKLEGVETITSGNSAEGYFCVTKSNCTLSRDTSDGALVITLDGSASTAGFQIFNNGSSVNDTLMPGDILQGVLDCQVVSASGQCEGPEMEMQIMTPGSPATNDGFCWANSVTVGYAKFALPSQRLLYLTDPYEIKPGKAGDFPQCYLLVNSAFTAGNPSACVVKVYECSPHRIFVSPNGEYSANQILPLARKNISCLTSTASAGFSLQLPPLAYVEDGAVVSFYDTQGIGATKNVTLIGGNTNQGAADWAGSTAYSVGTVRRNGFGNYYTVTTAGTSASSGGPTGTGTGITDGSAVWSYITPDHIIDGAASATSVVLSTNYFHKGYRANKGAAAWVAV